MVLEMADGTSIEELFDGLDCMLLGHLTAEQFISVHPGTNMSSIVKP